jgi:alkaline phosphatase D
MQRPNGYALYDFMSSKLTNVHTHDIMPNSLFGYNKKCSFGILEFDTTLDDPSLTYTIKNIDNEEIHKMTIYKSDLDYDEDKVTNKKNYKK